MESFDSSLYPQTSFQDTGAKATKEYAGFWRRLGAYILDSIILGAISYGVNYGIGRVWGNSISQSVLDEFMIQQDQQAILNFMMGPMLELLLITSLGAFLVYWFYYAGFESSGLQATPGKGLVGIIVTDMDGERVGFGTATGRCLGKYISSLLLGIGYLMVAWTAQKQGLHDKIAGTLVMRKPRY
jgi:uncharacterized RDD family membrane protein YckC